MTNKGIVRLIAVLIAVAMPVLTALSVSAGDEQGAYQPETKYESPEINDLTGLGQEPEDISVTAGAEYLEKAWYEYVMYSDKAVASYRIDDNTRLLFYDPYTYTNAMIMELEDDDATAGFDTMSTYTISKTDTKSITACVSSTDTSTKAVQSSGKDEYHTDVDNNGTQKTEYNHDVITETQGKVTDKQQHYYKYVDTVELTVSETLKLQTVTGTTGVTVEVGSDTTASDTFGREWLTDYTTNDTIYSDDYKTTTTYSGESTIEDNTSSVTDGWTQLSDRVTKTLGSSRSTSSSWSETESVTVTKTYAATHFDVDGVTPLPWKIAHYEVLMPIKCVMQIKHSGEWVNISTVYTLLTTVKGTCRVWMENGQVYYEDWGSGKPVVATDFWGQFMTRERLMAAYSEQLYPSDPIYFVEEEGED